MGRVWRWRRRQPRWYVCWLGGLRRFCPQGKGPGRTRRSLTAVPVPYVRDPRRPGPWLQRAPFAHLSAPKDGGNGQRPGCGAYVVATGRAAPVAGVPGGWARPSWNRRGTGPLFPVGERRAITALASGNGRRGALGLRTATPACVASMEIGRLIPRRRNSSEAADPPGERRQGSPSGKATPLRRPLSGGRPEKPENRPCGLVDNLGAWSRTRNRPAAARRRSEIGGRGRAARPDMRLRRRRKAPARRAGCRRLHPSSAPIIRCHTPRRAVNSATRRKTQPEPMVGP